MVSPSDITGSLNNKWFASLSGLGDWVFNIVISILCLGILYFIFILFEHKEKILYYELYGGHTNKKEDYQIGKQKKARGRYLKKKGVDLFSIIVFPNVFKKHIIKPPEYTMRYREGMYFLKPSKNDWVCVERPMLTNTVALKIPEPDMDLWQQSAEEQVRRRTEDEDLMKKQIYMTAGIILGAFVLAGLIIWLSMSFAGNSINNALDKVSPLVDGLQKLAGTNNAPG